MSGVEFYDLRPPKVENIPTPLAPGIEHFVIGEYDIYELMMTPSSVCIASSFVGSHLGMKSRCSLKVLSDVLHFKVVITLTIYSNLNDTCTIKDGLE